MDTLKLVTNFSSNIVIFLSFTAFIIFVFGRTNSKINQLPWHKVIALRIGLTFVTCASLLNALTLSNPEWTEVFMNFGLAVVMVWAAIFHYIEFVLPYRAEKLEKKAERAVILKKVSKKPRKTTLNKK